MLDRAEAKHGAAHYEIRMRKNYQESRTAARPLSDQVALLPSMTQLYRQMRGAPSERAFMSSR